MTLPSKQNYALGEKVTKLFTYSYVCIAILLLPVQGKGHMRSSTRILICTRILNSKSVWRTTHRAARSVAVLHREEDLDIMQGLNEAARAAERAFMMREIYIDQQEAVARELRHCKDCKEPILCVRHSAYFSAKPYVYPAENLCSSHNELADGQEY